jgi:hypothetical protein
MVAVMGRWLVLLLGLSLGAFATVGYSSCHQPAGINSQGVLRDAPRPASHVDLHLRSDGFTLFDPNVGGSEKIDRELHSSEDTLSPDDPSLATADVISGRWVDVRGRQPLLIREADEPLLRRAPDMERTLGSGAEYPHVIVELSRGDLRLVAPRCYRKPLLAGRLTLHSAHGSLQGKITVKDGVAQVQSTSLEPSGSMPMIDVESIDAPAGLETLQCDLPDAVSDGQWWLQVRFSMPIQVASQASIEVVSGKAKVMRSWRIQLPPMPNRSLVTQIALWPSSSLDVDSVPLLTRDVVRDGEWVTLVRHDEYPATLEHVIRTAPPSGASSALSRQAVVDNYQDGLWIAADVALDGLAFTAVTGTDMHFAHLTRLVLKSRGSTRLFIANRKTDIDATSQQQLVSARGQVTLVTSLSLRNSSSKDLHLHWYSAVPMHGANERSVGAGLAGGSWQRAEQPWHDDTVVGVMVESTVLGELVRCTVKAGTSGDVGLNWRRLVSTPTRRVGQGGYR